MNDNELFPDAAVKPKAAPVAGVALTALAAILLVGLSTFAGPCASHPDGTAPVCTWAARAVMGAGAILSIISIIRIFETDEGERRGLSLSAALIGALIAATPGWVIALCDDAAMSCNTTMHPFVTAVGVAVFLVGAVDLTRRLLRVFRHSGSDGISEEH
ncbi:MAG: DUF4418 family protein [Eggerthellaceae bacterium]|nr:DUF4418 family protein [Eggerthellaceae bacterium]